MTLRTLGTIVIGYAVSFALVIWGIPAMVRLAVYLAQ